VLPMASITEESTGIFDSPSWLAKSFLAQT